MSDISLLATDSLRRSDPGGAILSPRHHGEPGAAAPAPTAQADSVELSDTARFLARLRDLPDVRQDVIDRARASIDAGAYDSPDVLNTTADRLAADLDLTA